MENDQEWVLFEANTDIKKTVKSLEDKIDNFILNINNRIEIINKQNDKIIKQNEHILKSLNDKKTKINEFDQIRNYNRNWRGTYLHGGLLPFAYNYGLDTNV